MIDPARLQITLAKSSKRSSQRDRLLARIYEPFAVSQEAPILPCAGSLNSPCRGRQSRFDIYQPVPFSGAHLIPRSKPILKTPAAV